MRSSNIIENKPKVSEWMEVTAFWFLHLSQDVITGESALH